MSSITTGVRLYDFQGRYQLLPVQYGPYQQFRTPQTEYLASLQVNGPANRQALPQSPLGFTANGLVGQVAQPTLAQAITFGSSAYASKTNLSEAAVTQPYTQRIQSYAVQPANQAQLMASRDFYIFNGPREGAGLHVLTDGTNVTDVSLAPLNKDNRSGTRPAVPFVDRSDISDRAAGKISNGIPTNSLQLIGQPNAANTLLDRLNALDGQENPFQVLPLKASVKAGAQLRREISPLQGPSGADINPLLQQFQRIRQTDFLAAQVTGPDAEITNEQARNLSTVNAKYGVRVDESLQINLARLRENLAVEASHGKLAQRVLQVRDGAMPTTPYVPLGETSPTATWTGSGNNILFQLETAVDTAGKKSAGGAFYQNPGHSQGDSQRRPRKPFYTMA